MPPGICPQRVVLVNAYTKAVSNYNQIQSAQVAAIVRGDTFQFDAEMQSARRAVDLARAEILKHEREHGCDIRFTTVSTG